MSPHSTDIGRAIAAVRSWISSVLPAIGHTLPGGRAIFTRYTQFSAALPGLCASYRVEVDELIFTNRVRMAEAWLQDTATADER